ncbi:MAG: hypothetical protein M0R74_00990 [Dehalococcoidia bacterium]|jgi:hypothetical protein|nr:hypothetical protein [Dehalococcoidia bacterium]
MASWNEIILKITGRANVKAAAQKASSDVKNNFDMKDLVGRGPSWARQLMTGFHGAMIVMAFRTAYQLGKVLGAAINANEGPFLYFWRKIQSAGVKAFLAIEEQARKTAAFARKSAVEGLKYQIEHDTKDREKEERQAKRLADVEKARAEAALQSSKAIDAAAKAKLDTDDKIGRTQNEQISAEEDARQAVYRTKKAIEELAATRDTLSGDERKRSIAEKNLRGELLRRMQGTAVEDMTGAWNEENESLRQQIRLLDTDKDLLAEKYAVAESGIAVLQAELSAQETIARTLKEQHKSELANVIEAERLKEIEESRDKKIREIKNDKDATVESDRASAAIAAEQLTLLREQGASVDEIQASEQQAQSQKIESAQLAVEFARKELDILRESANQEKEVSGAVTDTLKDKIADADTVLAQNEVEYDLQERILGVMKEQHEVEKKKIQDAAMLTAYNRSIERITNGIAKTAEESILGVRGKDGGFRARDIDDMPLEERAEAWKARSEKEIKKGLKREAREQEKLNRAAANYEKTLRDRIGRRTGKEAQNIEDQLSGGRGARAAKLLKDALTAAEDRKQKEALEEKAFNATIQSAGLLETIEKRLVM